MRKRAGTRKGLSPNPENRISRCVSKGKKQPYTCWRAVWYDENYKVRKREFSVLKFTEEGSKILALEEATKNHNYKSKKETLVKPIDPYEKQKFRIVSREDVEVLASINSTAKQKNRRKIEELNSDPYGFEGEKSHVTHLSIERDRALRNRKVIEFLKENGELFCEVCDFNFSKVYKFLENNIIEVHHIKPLSELSEKTKVALEDLILLCANCHFAVHQGDCQKNLVTMKAHFNKRRKH